MDSRKSILSLPPNVLMVIIELVPNKAHLKLTCKNLNKIVSQIEAKRYRLSITSEQVKTSESGEIANLFII